MRVVIVGRTRFGSSSVCLGALAVDGGAALRLCSEDGNYFSINSPFILGTEWEIEFKRGRRAPPHLEDVHLTSARPLGQIPDIHRFILERVAPWEGGIGNLFDGRLGFTATGRGYIANRLGVPGYSTGFWVPNVSLLKDEHGPYYRLGLNNLRREIKYVGVDAPPDVIHPRSLVRVSLAGWWHPDDSPDFEDRCYLQLSGVFPPAS